MHKLLVPFDFSIHATNALDYAMALASQIKASVTIFHSYTPASVLPVGIKEDPSVQFEEQVDLIQREEITAKINEALLNYLDSFYLGSPEKVKTEIVLRRDDFFESFKEHAEGVAYNIVIMGTEGAFGWQEIFGGSDTSKASKNVEANFLVIPIEGIYGGVHKMAYATDFDKYDTDKIKELIDFNSFFGAEIDCLHVTQDRSELENDKKKLEKLEDKFEKEEKIKFVQLLDHQVEEALFTYAKDHSIDILAITPQEHGFLHRLFKESYTKKMTLHTTLPLLIIK